MLEDTANGIVNEFVAAYNKSNSVEFAANVKFEFGSIRTTSHDAETDTYQCLATVTIKDSMGNVQESDVEYEVYSVVDKGDTFEVKYDESALAMPLKRDANKQLEAQFAPIDRQRQIDALRQELAAARSTGDWYKEKNVMGRLSGSGEQVPPRTPEEEANFDPNSSDTSSPAWCAASLSTVDEPGCKELIEKYRARLKVPPVVFFMDMPEQVPTEAPAPAPEQPAE